MLTKLMTVKDRLAMPDNLQDAFITGLIQLCGGQFDAFCSRKFAWTDNVTQEFTGDEMEIAVRAYPIEFVSGFELQRTQREGWKPIQGNDVDFLIKHDCVIALTAPLGAN